MGKTYYGDQFEAEEMVDGHTGQPRGDWGVVNYETGMVRHECLTREEAERLAAELNESEGEE